MKMVIQLPKTYFLVAGASGGFSLLNAFDGALLNAGIGDVNLVRLSSILPPSCTKIEPLRLPYGSLVPVAYANKTSSEKYETISSAVAIGIPEDETLAGLIMEYSDANTKTEVEYKVREMVKEGMQMRNRKFKKIISISSTYEVVDYGATFAGVVLWV